MFKNFSSNATELLYEFEKIRNKGFVKATRRGDTGIGKTLEDLLQKKEDNLQLPDFHDIEIKSRNKFSNALITLFTKSPTYPKSANTMLRNQYGYKRDDAIYNVLYMTTSCNSISTNQYMNVGFKARVDSSSSKVFLEIYSEDKLISNDVFWSFDALKNALEKKLKYICLVSAEEKIINDEVYFKYTDIELYDGLTFENFLEALSKGDIYIDTRIGTYPDGRSHDRGTGFRIRSHSLLEYSRRVY